VPKRTSYRDLEISINKNEAAFRVAGEDYRGPHRLNRATLARLNQLRGGGGNPGEYGRVLFDALFQGRLRDGIRAARNMDRVSWRLRLNIASDAESLNRLWWECLSDVSPPPRTLGRWANTPLSRYLLGGRTKNVQADKLHVLVVIANPADLGSGKWSKYKRLDDEVEKKTIVGALDSLKDRIGYKILDAPATQSAISKELKTGKYHVLHIVAHGAYDQAEKQMTLMLEDDQRRATPVDRVRLADILGTSGSIQLVVLAACLGAWQAGNDVFTGLGPIIVRYGVPAVVAMQDPIAEPTALFFTKKFYGALARWSDDTGGMVDVAMNEARDELFVAFANDSELWDWAIPVLFLRGTGRLFRLETRDHQPDRSTRGAVEGLKGPRPRATTVDPSQRRLALERARLWDMLTLEAGLEMAELDSICDLYWQVRFSQLEGEDDDARKRTLIRRAQEDNLPLAARIRAAMKLREKKKLGPTAAGGATPPVTSWSDLSGLRQ
jgi:hypothetical protein